MVVESRAGAAPDVPRIRHLDILLRDGALVWYDDAAGGRRALRARGAVARAADRLGGAAGGLVFGFAGRFGRGRFSSRGLSWRWVGGNDWLWVGVRVFAAPW